MLRQTKRNVYLPMRKIKLPVETCANGCGGWNVEMTSNLSSGGYKKDSVTGSAVPFTK